jgi:hypothetical protein
MNKDAMPTLKYVWLELDIRETKPSYMVTVVVKTEGGRVITYDLAVFKQLYPQHVELLNKQESLMNASLRAGNGTPEDIRLIKQ